MNLLENTYTLVETEPIWATLADRMMFYLRDTGFDFVETMKYFKLVTKFRADFWKEIPPNGKAFQVRFNILIYLATMNLRILQYNIAFPLIKEAKKNVKD